MSKQFSDAILASTSEFLLRVSAGPFAFGFADDQFDDTPARHGNEPAKAAQPPSKASGKYREAS
ncbi:MAG: hypothetical protein AseanaTS_09740 [Candidatus Pelagadaptatus aseana]|uniref:hypothetical protein n=1 Tax=Candidatus Pelagadaptatus aseana TaxID=3120508 RepID=UPI0039B21056